MSELERLRKNPVHIGISACLLGQPVRYDGRDRRQDWLAEFGELVTWLPVCPEVELGLGVPREPIELVRPAMSGGHVRLIAVETGRDLTGAMLGFAAARLDALATERLSGYIFKSRSPSCGVTRVRVFEHAGLDASSDSHGRGMFAAALMERFPALPVTEEEGLASPEARAAFLQRVLEYHRAGGP